MNKTTAIAIVQSANRDASDVIVNDLLEKSKGSDYRPYWVAAQTLSLNPPNQNLSKAEDVAWFDWRNRIQSLLDTQAAMDGLITDIPIGTEAYALDVIPMAAIISTNGNLTL